MPKKERLVGEEIVFYHYSCGAFFEGTAL